MRAELERLAERGISEDELERGIGQLRGGLVLGMEDTGSRMTRLGKAELVYGEYVGLDERCPGSARSPRPTSRPWPPTWPAAPARSPSSARSTRTTTSPPPSPDPPRAREPLARRSGLPAETDSGDSLKQGAGPLGSRRDEHAEPDRRAVIGAAGRMGSEVCRAVEAAPDLVLAGRYDVGDELGDLSGAQVAVDFTVPDATLGNVLHAVERRRPRRRRHHRLDPAPARRRCGRRWPSGRTPGC